MDYAQIRNTKKLKRYIEELKTIKTETLQTDPKFLTVESTLYYLNNGKTIIREQLKKQNQDGSASIVLPVTKNKKILFVIEPRIGPKKTVAVGLPAGYIENNEKPLDAAIRELEEETGYVCTKYHLLAKYYQDPGISKAYNYAYLGLEAERLKEQSLDPTEAVRFLECDYDEALELIRLGYIEDLQAQFVLEKAKQYLSKRREPYEF